MGWFKRLSEGIQTSTTQKKEAPDGLWQQCKNCGKTNTVKELSNNFLKCPGCNHHVRIGSFDYFDLLFDGRYKELFTSIYSYNFLEFEDVKTYDERLDNAHKKTTLNDALTVATGKIKRKPIIILHTYCKFI